MAADLLLPSDMVIRDLQPINLTRTALNHRRGKMGRNYYHLELECDAASMREVLRRLGLHPAADIV